MIPKHKPYTPTSPRCKIPDCDETARREKGTLCSKHYSRIKKYGDADAVFSLKKGEWPKLEKGQL